MGCNGVYQIIARPIVHFRERLWEVLGGAQEPHNTGDLEIAFARIRG
jgi:hypothetical protein